MRRTFLLFIIVFIMLAGYSLAGTRSKEVEKMAELRISSPAFNDNAPIPKKYTCDGSDVNPALKIENVTSGAKSLALIVDDPDAPRGTWVHWVVWNVDPKHDSIDEDSVPPGARQGTNDFGRRDYGGPCPPSGTHRYFFKLYALDKKLDLPAGASKADLEKAIEGHVLQQSRIVGLYSRR